MITPDDEEALGRYEMLKKSLSTNEDWMKRMGHVRI
jgi:hypothetical protein